MCSYTVFLKTRLIIHACLKKEVMLQGEKIPLFVSYSFLESTELICLRKNVLTLWKKYNVWSRVK